MALIANVITGYCGYNAAHTASILNGNGFWMGIRHAKARKTSNWRNFRLLLDRLALLLQRAIYRAFSMNVNMFVLRFF